MGCAKLLRCRWQHLCHGAWRVGFFLDISALVLSILLSFKHYLSRAECRQHPNLLAGGADQEMSNVTCCRLLVVVMGVQKSASCARMRVSFIADPKLAWLVGVKKRGKSISSQIVTIAKAGAVLYKL